MTYQLSPEEQSARDSTTATTALIMLANEPGRLKAFTNGLNRYGDAFAAFLLIPEVKEVFAGDLLDRYLQTYETTGTSLDNAVEELLARMRWRETLAARRGEPGTADLLYWSESTLREFIKGEYRFITTNKGIHVFDCRPLIITYDY